MPGNTRLNEISTPNGSVNLNTQKIIGLVDPSNPQEAATKNYVDGVVAGLVWKEPVRVVGTAPITAGAAPGGPQTIDGVAVANNNRVLLVGQTNAQWNGIWSVSTGGSWNRVSDANQASELVNAAVFVTEGTTYADTGWVCTANLPITVDTTALPWVQFANPAEVIDGQGLVKTGQRLDVGAGNGITVNADSVQIQNGGIVDAMIAAGNLDPAKLMSAVPITKGGTGATTATAARTALVATGRYSSASHAAGTTISVSAAGHGLANHRGLIVQVLDEATGNVELPDITISAGGDVTVTFGVSVAMNSKRVNIIGGF